MQQVANYGSFLQAYGLKSILKNLGCHVEFIDIVRGVQLQEYRQGKFAKIKKGIQRLNCHNPLKMVYYSLYLHKRFGREFTPFLYKDNTGIKHYDAVVIGSDEVFNVAQSTWFGFSSQLFGEHINADNVISYAACCGATTVEKLRDLGLETTIGSMLKNNFKALSVRDDNSVNLVKELTGINPIKNIDPVLLYSFDADLPVKTPHTGKPYMIIYTYPNRMRNRDEVNAIKSYARANGLEIISMGDYFDWVDTVVVPDPFEVLAYFRDATCIVTDTFHGSVMSIKYNKPFATIVRGMNSNKLTGLLEQFGLSDRIVSNPSHISGILDTPIDYNQVNILIEKEQQKSIDYLKSNLS